MCERGACEPEFASILSPLIAASEEARAGPRHATQACLAGLRSCRLAPSWAFMPIRRPHAIGDNFRRGRFLSKPMKRRSEPGVISGVDLQAVVDRFVFDMISNQTSDRESSCIALIEFSGPREQAASAIVSSRGFQYKE